MLFVLACPKCGHNNLRPSRIRNVGEILLTLVAAPYRCRLCDHRELVFRLAVPRSHDEDESESMDVGVAKGVPGASAAAPQSTIAVKAAAGKEASRHS